MKLWKIAHSRAGDKGDISNVSVIAYDPRNFRVLEEYLTPERVKAHFAGIVQGDVVRYALPKLGALNFLMYRADIVDVGCCPSREELCGISSRA